ncbi:hypothetical protein EJB05_21109, partial [Eragrostis curvula]
MAERGGGAGGATRRRRRHRVAGGGLVRADRGDRRPGLHVVRLPHGALYTLISNQAAHGLPAHQESPCTDCCVHCCCEPCALCQMYRELSKKGFDMSQGIFSLFTSVLSSMYCDVATLVLCAGWQANMEIQGRTAATVHAAADAHRDEPVMLLLMHLCCHVLKATVIRLPTVQICA